MLPTPCPCINSICGPRRPNPPTCPAASTTDCTSNEPVQESLSTHIHHFERPHSDMHTNNMLPPLSSGGHRRILLHPICKLTLQKFCHPRLSKRPVRALLSRQDATQTIVGIFALCALSKAFIAESPRCSGNTLSRCVILSLKEQGLQLRLDLLACLVHR